MNTDLRMLMLLSLALLTMTAGTGLAQDASVAASPEPDPVFDIEVIVFEYVDGVRGSREDWRYIDSGRDGVARSLQDDIASALNDAGQTDVAEQETPLEAPLTDAATTTPKVLSFEPILGDSLRLTDTYSRLRNSRDFRPIAHAGWRQPVFDRGNETTLDLARVARLPTNLDGKASIYVSRFLHLTLDLQLADNRAVTSGLDSLVFKLNERRKLRSGELNFYDHPRFGALALISRTDQPEASAPSE